MRGNFKRALRCWIVRLVGPLGRGRWEREMAEELDGHLQALIESHLQARMPPDEARRLALLKFGGWEQAKEAIRERRTLPWVESLWQDLRWALRRLAAKPGFLLIAIVLLGCGVATATAMFSLCDAVLLRPLPGVASARGLMHLERVERGTLLGDFSYPDYLDYRSMSRSFAALAATSPDPWDLVLSGHGETVAGELVSGNYFSVLGVRAELGRVLAPRDEHQGQDRVVVVSDSLWRSRFGGNAGALGRTIEVNRVPLTVVGVAAPGFQGGSLRWSSDFWAPIVLQPAIEPMGNCLLSRLCGWVTIFGRLAPGAGMAQARDQFALISARIAMAHPLLRARRAALVAGVGSWSDDHARLAGLLMLLLFASLLLAAMTSASLGSLFLARMGARQHEVATQLALGASRWRVARQFLLEAAVVGASGGALGWFAAEPLARWLPRLAPSAPANLVPELDWRVAAFVLALAGSATAVTVLAPVLLAAHACVGLALQQGGRGLARARHSAQQGLLAAEVGIAFFLLLAAGLTTRSLRAATAGQVPIGAGHTVIALLDLGRAGYHGAGSGQFFSRLRSGISRQPGIAAVTVAECIPPTPCNRGPVFPAGAEPSAALVHAHEFASAYVRPEINWVSSGFFSMFSDPLVAGRGFTAADRDGSPLVCVVNARLARRLWPHGSPLGRRIAWPQYNWTGAHDFTVVGVTADRRTRSLVESPPEAMYVPAAQVRNGRLWVAARGWKAPGETLAVLRRQVAALDPSLPIESARTLAAQIRRSLWQPLAIAALSGIFGLLAMLLAALGLFGAAAQMVVERRRELGVRLALGATPVALVGLVVGDATVPLWIGLGAGLIAGLAGTRLLAPWLYGVAPTDAATWAGAAALLAGATVTAAVLAGARASGLHAMDALRCE